MVYAKKVASDNPMFNDRSSAVGTVTQDGYKLISVIPVPNNLVLCNGCNTNIAETASKEGYLIYLGKKELEQNLPYDIYCPGCTEKYFPKAKKV